MSDKPIFMRLDKIQSEKPNWLWPGYIASRAITFIDGDPGLGKSFVACDIAARVSSGNPMPDGQPGDQGRVLLISYEDDPATTIKPRLESLNAKLDNIVLLTGFKTPSNIDRPPTIHDIGSINDTIREGSIKLVVVDPLMAALPEKIDSHKDQSIRLALSPLARLAQETNIAVLIVRHLNKSASGNALYRGSGSIGIIGAARAGFLIGKDPKDHSARILANTKMNIAPEPPSMKFRIIDTGSGATLQWEGRSELKACDLLQNDSPDGFRKGPKKAIRPRNFLKIF